MASYSDDHATYAQEQAADSNRREPSSGRLDRTNPLLATLYEQESIDNTTTTARNVWLDMAQYLQTQDASADSLMSRMIAALLEEGHSEDKSHGVNQEFIDSIDRVSKTSLKTDDSCPICATPYLDDKYPLVVSLRCHHKFDLECITPWLKLHTTCPMCRADVQRRKIEVPKDSEEEYDETYG